MMRSVAVFCGSKPGANPKYAEMAETLAGHLVRNGISLVYGGASVGLMGLVADRMVREGGQVIGVLPKRLADKEIAHAALTELHIVDNMHERKALMYDRSDGFIILPGGIGTMDELFEVLTWNYLGEHRKPCGLLEIDGYYEPLVSLLDHMTEQQFMSGPWRDFLKVDTDPAKLLEKMGRA